MRKDDFRSVRADIAIDEQHAAIALQLRLQAGRQLEIAGCVTVHRDHFKKQPNHGPCPFVDSLPALLADLAVAVLSAPGVAVGVGIAEMMSILPALLVGVSDRDADHLALG